MARVKIAEFGIIQKALAQSVVTFYVADDNGESTGTKATLYQAATGSDTRENPQTLDTDGKLSADCYVETQILAAITGITDRTERSLKKIQQNPLQFALPVTSANVKASDVSDSVTAAAASATAAASSASSASTAAATASSSASSAAASATDAQTAETNAETAQAAAEAAQTAAETAAASADNTVKVSSDDTTPGTLEDKLTVNTSFVSFTTNNSGANEERQIVVSVASQAQAEAGTANLVAMTPLRTSQAIAALSPSIDLSAVYLLIGLASADTIGFEDAVVDPFTDETDVDTATSTNEAYDGTNDLYSPSTTEPTPSIPIATGGSDAANMFDDNDATDAVSNAIGNVGASSVADRRVFMLDFGMDIDVGKLRAEQIAASSGSGVAAGFYYATDAAPSTWVAYDTGDTDIPLTSTPVDSEHTSNVTARYFAIVAQATNWSTVGMLLGEFRVYDQSLNEIRGAPNDMSLRSNSFTANAAPDEAQISFILSGLNAGDATLDTDIVGYISRDGGTTYTAATLTRTLLPDGNYFCTATVDISGQPSGTSMKWRIDVLNENAINLHAVSLEW